ncbi:hypothetical protein JTE90_028583 [Oedothorax gibbosus]|uniref:Transposase n=1 Tax=Oedothorax gibbosus TaxID=931172 RepID=A0AAV6TXZ8_9ARAC|nr:hypothetical protein JTE90_028583 [Oedothorax gibbosus]
MKLIPRRFYCNSLAAALCLYQSTGLLGSTVGHTAKFVGKMDKLFDSLKSRTKFSSKPLGGALTGTSEHLEFWQSSAKFKTQSPRRTLFQLLKKGGIITLHAMAGIWESLKDYQFSEKQVLNVISDLPPEENLTTEQLDSVFDDSLFNDSFIMNEEPPNSDQEACDQAKPLGVIEDNVLAYVAGFLAKKFVSKVLFCHQCSHILVIEKALDQNTLLLYFKEYHQSTEYGLRWPSQPFLLYIHSLSNIITPNLYNALHQKSRPGR